MSYFHIIGKVGVDEKYRVLFSDLSAESLADRFVKPYGKGIPFFSGNDLISPSDLRSIQIIRTDGPEKRVRDEINRKDRYRIDRLNNSSSSLFFVSVGRGYDPEDIAEAGEDVTHAFIKGHPGFKAGRWEPSRRMVAWLGSIIATVVAAGIVKWLGWL